MSRSSSSSLGSSLMRLNSLRTLGSRLWRLADGPVDDLRAAPLMLVDAGAVLLHGEQVILERGVHALRRLGLGDRPAERANPPSSLEEPQAPLELLDALARVRHRRVWAGSTACISRPPSAAPASRSRRPSARAWPS